MKAVQLRIEIKEKRASLVRGWRRSAMSGAAELSDFQYKRRERMLDVAERYFVLCSGVDQIGDGMNLSHQRVSAILSDAVRILESKKLIERRPAQHSKKRKG